MVKTGTDSDSTLQGPYPAGWFGDFSQGESTYTYDGLFANRQVNPTINVDDGWDPALRSPYASDALLPAKFFTETQSGGYKEAWQSYYPAVKHSTAGNHEETGDWWTGAGGVLQQDYKDAQGSLASPSLAASWFDNSVYQLDGFGRKKLPALGSPAYYLYWDERSVNTTLSCKEPGCIASVSLKAPFDPEKEVYKNCLLSIFFHPTDFDDRYSRENIEWIRLNTNITLEQNCRPTASGCNKSAARPLLPCVRDLPIDKLIPTDGALTISAKIPDTVDECPYEGNLLSAVPMVTCLVTDKAKAKAMEVGRPAPKILPSCNASMPFQCETSGCAVEIGVNMDKTCAVFHNKCTMSVTVNQTDYDNPATETIEYIKVNGKEAAKDLKPGKNPCSTKWQGTPLQESELTFEALKDYDVTESIKINGSITLEGKISRLVDECAQNGYLFDGLASVTCSGPPAADAGSKK